MKPMGMLADVLRRAVLTRSERESFEDMWDRLSRSKKGPSHAQKAWIERIYFGQKLDRPPESPLRRRVVIPTWQKDQPTQQRVATNAEVVTPVPTTVSSSDLTGPGIVKTNARFIRRKSGTFQALVPPPSVSVDSSAVEASKVGFINYAGVQREELVTSLLALEEVCPRIEPGSKQYEKIAGFFQRGGVVLKVRPLSEAQVA